MIERLHIRGFKRFATASFQLAPLTVLAGLNGTGKTSLIHALLLAREASQSGDGGIVRLNGPFGLELGTAADVRNWAVEGDIEVALEWDGGNVATWRFTETSDDALFLQRAAVPDHPPPPFTGMPRVFTYLCADRLGPRSILGSAALPPEVLEVGARGEFSAQVLAGLGDRLLPDESRIHPDSGPDDVRLLKYQVERWLSEIARPVEIDTDRFAGTPVMALRFRVPGGDWVRAPNMGFGVTYALPVVLGGLTAARKGLVIVENPEAHLHPAGQSRIGIFLAWLAAHGVQVVIETHSDHVLNGIRRAIGELRYLPATDALVHSFSPDDTGTVHCLRFTSLGGLNDWPAGFFDQYQLDVAALGRVRRQRS